MQMRRMNANDIVGHWHLYIRFKNHAKHVTPKLNGLSLQNAKSRNVWASKSADLHPENYTTIFLRLWQETSARTAESGLGSPEQAVSAGRCFRLLTFWRKTLHV